MTLVHFKIDLVQSLRHINVFSELWVYIQLFQENLGTCRLANTLEGTLAGTLVAIKPIFISKAAFLPF